MITQILKDDCDELCRDAAEFLKNGLIKRALDKYEESFVKFLLFLSYFIVSMVRDFTEWLNAFI